MTPLLAKLDARDRALFQRWLLVGSVARRTRLLWTALTHLGGARVSIVAVVLPLLLQVHGDWHDAAWVGVWTLALSHLGVQVAKRAASRPRPHRSGAGHWHVDIPDEFSFPSGHACAAMSVAFAYAMAFPRCAVPLLILATVIGVSRVRLGVHYPGDVVAGQLLAIVTGIGVHAWI